ncbi:hypothetical protein CSOJ01_14696 [Colletotrichum sojae]|uniref:Uncharacterized protein n=1 Tax=Colletotrichum sojae TaxID=2175907 RepID=A0A8H6MJ15_9PEZI|nr:hypothetical protein CSOJ01_14696 [Colletotrichum sojae]
MRFSLTFLFHALLISYVNCCFDTGKQGDYGKWLLGKDLATNQEQLAVACGALVGRGEIKFAARERRHFCIQQENGFKWDFQLKYIRSGSRAIGIEECMGGMRKEVKCLRGGQTSYYNWEYM